MYWLASIRLWTTRSKVHRDFIRVMIVVQTIGILILERMH
jgi:hypothetical protein